VYQIEDTKMLIALLEVHEYYHGGTNMICSISNDVLHLKFSEKGIQPL